MPQPVILLVDDSASDRLLILRAFELADVQAVIMVARDGVEALDLLLPSDRDRRLRPAFVLLDLVMPRMGGLSLLQELRADPTTASLPVIVLSDSVIDRDRIASYQHGANAFITKPHAFQDLTAIVHKITRFWLYVNEQPTRLRT